MGVDHKAAHEKYVKDQAAKNRARANEALSRWTIEHGKVVCPMTRDGTIELGNFEVVLVRTPADGVVEDLIAQGFNARIVSRRRFFVWPQRYLEVSV